MIRKSVPRTAWSGSIESSFVQDPQAGIEEKVSVVWLHEYKMTGHIEFVKTPLGKFLVEKMAYYGYLVVTSPSGQMLANAAKWSQMASADVELGLHDRAPCF